MSYSTTSDTDSEIQEREEAISDCINELENKGDFKYLMKIGDGTYGDVLKVCHTKSGIYKAVKVIIPKYVSENELLMWAHLKHKNIICAEEAKLLSDATVVIIMPLQFNSLDEVLSDDRFIDFSRSTQYIRRWLFDALLALDYMHGKGICHLDVKLNNILLSYDGDAIVSDFSCSTKTRITLLPDDIGAPDIYRAPELFKDFQKEVQLNGPAIDCWSFGVLTVEAFTGEYLSDQLYRYRSWKKDIRPLFKLMVRPKVFAALQEESFPNSVLSSADLEQAMDFLDCFLRLNAEDRIPAGRALNHPFLAESKTMKINLSELYTREELSNRHTMDEVETFAKGDSPQEHHQSEMQNNHRGEHYNRKRKIFLNFVKERKSSLERRKNHQNFYNNLLIHVLLKCCMKKTKKTMIKQRAFRKKIKLWLQVQTLTKGNKIASKTDISHVIGEESSVADNNGSIVAESIPPVQDHSPDISVISSSSSITLPVVFHNSFYSDQDIHKWEELNNDKAYSVGEPDLLRKATNHHEKDMNMTTKICMPKNIKNVSFSGAENIGEDKTCSSMPTYTRVGTLKSETVQVEQEPAFHMFIDNTKHNQNSQLKTRNWFRKRWNNFCRHFL